MEELILQLGAHSKDSKVSINGIDISKMLRGVKISCMAGELTKVDLFVAYGKEVDMKLQLPEYQIVMHSHPLQFTEEIPHE